MEKSKVRQVSTADILMRQYGPTMTASQVAQVLHHHPSHVRALCARGDLPACRVGGRWTVSTTRLAALIDG